MRTGTYFFKHIAGIATLTATTFCTLYGQSINLREVKSRLSQPVVLLLENGQQSSGEINAWDGETLSLRTYIGGGSASMNYAADAIRDISFTGSEYLPVLYKLEKNPARSDEAFALFEAFYQQRGRYLRYMDVGELGMFVRYARFCLTHEKPLRAVAVIEVIRPYIKDDALLRSLDEATLMGFFLGELYEEAEAQACQWIESTGYDRSSALGWQILAQLQFMRAAYEDAMWTALNPIAFANNLPIEHLGACYALAISAAAETRHEAISERLTKEMQARGFAWPAKLAILAKYNPLTKDTSVSKEQARPVVSSLVEPIQTPSPIDSEIALPTRLQSNTSKP